MTSFIYKFALTVAILTLVLCMFSGISLLTCIVRASIVFIGILFTFFLAGLILNVGLTLAGSSKKTKDKS